MDAGRTAVRPEDFAYCGIDCTDCDVYKASAHGDEEARRRALKTWTKTAQEHWGMTSLDPAILKCKGCRAEGKDIFKGCRHCPIRACARRRGLASCGLCPEWRTCKRLDSLLGDCPEARPVLERIEAARKS
jgi:hypothetical protein